MKGDSKPIWTHKNLMHMQNKNPDFSRQQYLFMVKINLRLLDNNALKS